LTGNVDTDILIVILYWGKRPVDVSSNDRRRNGGRRCMEKGPADGRTGGRVRAAGCGHRGSVPAVLTFESRRLTLTEGL
jgi:hypothetical protein